MAPRRKGSCWLKKRAFTITMKLAGQHFTQFGEPWRSLARTSPCPGSRAPLFTKNENRRVAGLPLPSVSPVERTTAEHRPPAAAPGARPAPAIRRPGSGAPASVPRPRPLPPACGAAPGALASVWRLGPPPPACVG